MSRFWSTALLSAALMVPIAVAPSVLRAQDQKAGRSYHDKKNNDDHAWNGQEDKAYRIYAKQNHRKASEFSKLKDDDQQRRIDRAAMEHRRHGHRRARKSGTARRGNGFSHRRQ